MVYRGATRDGRNVIVEPKYGQIRDWLLPLITILEEIEEFLGLAQTRNKVLMRNVHL